MSPHLLALGWSLFVAAVFVLFAVLEWLATRLYRDPPEADR